MPLGTSAVLPAQYLNSNSNSNHHNHADDDFEKLSYSY